MNTQHPIPNTEYRTPNPNHPILVLCIIYLALASSCSQNSTSNPKKPNILIVISDDQSYPHTSFAGSKFVNTPAFDRVAREGVYFTNAYAGSPGCAPSRSALITGRHHWQNEQSGQHFSSWMKKHVPFTDELKANGYAVGRIGKGVHPFRLAKKKTDTLWRKENPAGPDYLIHTYDENDTRVTKQVRNNNYTENFKYFMDSIRGDQPFFCWVGVYEPHRAYEEGSWKRLGKKLEDVDVPAFLPDDDAVRGDLLDYAVEIEWFDLHLQRILDYLEEIGELDNTIVIVTGDNGMPFPRAKANAYDYGVHVPMAIRYPKEIAAGTVCKTPIGFTDFAPTLLSVAGITPQQMLPMSGENVWDIITGQKEDPDRAVYSGRERHTTARYQNLGYPQRAIRKGDYLLIWNPTPEREPAGAPQKYSSKDTTQLEPMYGLDENGKYANEDVFTDISTGPTKTFIIENHDSDEYGKYFELATKNRPEFELYNVEKDMECVTNLAGAAEYSEVENSLKTQLFAELERSNDPRMSEADFNIFETYIRYNRIKKFPKPAYIND